MRVDGVGFRKADAAARLVFKIAADSPLRIQKATTTVLEEAEKDGHTTLSQYQFEQQLMSLLNLTTRPAEIPIDSASIVFAQGMYSRRRTYVAEQTIATTIRGMLDAGLLPDELEYCDDALAADQKQALRAMSRSRLFILTGVPGTGKTRTIKAIIDASDARHIALCAPSAKAAKRIEELTGVSATTIHRLLEVEPHNFTEEERARCKGECSSDIKCRICAYKKIPYAHCLGFKFHYRRDHPLPYHTVIVDETSMVAVDLMADLCEALLPDARLILIGDTFQLPSVGPGSVLRDLIASDVPGCELTTLKRQNPELLIARNCQLIRFEKRIHIDNKAAADFFVIERANAAEIAATVVDCHVNRIAQRYGLDPTKDIVTLTALKEYGELSTSSLNYALRQKLNPNIFDARLDPLSVGDRVIQTKNDYDREIFNGDLGIIEDCDAKYLWVRFDTPPRTVEIPRFKCELMLAWALTVHKAQGSEWPWVIIPIHREQGFKVTNAQWLYTAISRARDGCVIIGQSAVARRLAKDHRPTDRITRLAKMPGAES
jgi:exodeoxyribonuclease V alpha subunit